MTSLNKVQLIGYLGSDPNVINGANFIKTVKLSLATTENWKDKLTGERREKTEWHKIVIFNEKICDIAEKYLKKGSQIYVEGQLQTREWIDKEGMKHFTTEIILSKFKGEIILLGNKGNEEEKEVKNINYAREYDSAFAKQELNDEIPF